MNTTPKILLVDDEEAIAMMVGKRLIAEGYSVRVAVDGEEALKAAQAERPDLVVLDLMLPKINGYEVCKRLKESNGPEPPRVILFTAMTQEKDIKMGYQCGADAYIRKPFRSEELLGKIRELLAATGTRPVRGASPPA